MPAGSGVPNLDGVVTGARGEALSVGREGQRNHLTHIRVHGAELLSGGGVPQPDVLVGAARGKVLAVGRKGQRAHRSGLPVKREQFFLGIRIPDLDDPVAASRGQALVIGREGHRTHFLQMPGVEVSLPHLTTQAIEMGRGAIMVAHQQLEVGRKNGRGDSWEEAVAIAGLNQRRKAILRAPAQHRGRNDNAAVGSRPQLAEPLAV